MYYSPRGSEIEDAEGDTMRRERQETEKHTRGSMNYEHTTVYPGIKGTYTLIVWKKGKPEPTQGENTYYHMTCEQAFTKLIYSLNTGEDTINPLKLPYRDVEVVGSTTTDVQTERE